MSLHILIKLSIYNWRKSTNSTYKH